ncbi:hypothetical protein POTOM_045608 [Populus tomentosa]|uniref:Protein kinase domain-containing protein n=1 Tax=Populus tomentosa TaxID=118781 RepID=A0A8X7YI22_POPTO|nr:hypothetical protein POTOM_045608 [Populus tomentosa]
MCFKLLSFIVSFLFSLARDCPKQRKGNGTYGKVMKCKHKLDLMEYAVKKIKIGYHDREVILREASTHAKMHHKHIVRYHQAWTENLQLKSDHDDMCGSSSAGEDTAALFIQMKCCPMAPEAEKGPIDAKADVYSLGIILFMLLHPTAFGTERKNSLDKLKRIEFPDAWENESYRPLKSLLSDMLSENPDDRPSAKEVLPRVQVIY